MYFSILKSTEELACPGAFTGKGISKEAALAAARLEGHALIRLFALANAVRQKQRGNLVDICAIVNAKSGGCPEDCAYCAQSGKARSGIKSYPLMPVKEMAFNAKKAHEAGARRFCVVTSGKKPSKKELASIAKAITEIRKTGMLPCATLGILSAEDLRLLKDAGLERYHNNLETSERFFPHVCTTHSYKEKVKTAEAAKRAGLSLCCGGLFGIGETWEDRVDMALEIKRLEADSVPINFLIPVKGTRLAKSAMLPPLEALKIISVYRLLLPQREIRVCGGRLQCLGEFNSFVFAAGADGILTGNYLTKSGRQPEADHRLIKDFGLLPA